MSNVIDLNQVRKRNRDALRNYKSDWISELYLRRYREFADDSNVTDAQVLEILEDLGIKEGREFEDLFGDLSKEEFLTMVRGMI